MISSRIVRMKASRQESKMLLLRIAPAAQAFFSNRQPPSTLLQWKIEEIQCNKQIGTSFAFHSLGARRNAEQRMMNLERRHP